MKPLKNAIRNMRRTPYQTTASILVMVLTFFLLLLFLVASYGSNRILRHYEALPKISAYFTSDATQEDVETVKQKLEQTGKVSSIRFISQDEALKIFVDRYKNRPDITEFVQKSFLPMSLDIQALKPDDLDTIAQTLQSFDTIEQITFLKDEIQKLLSWTRAVRLSGLVITGYAMVTSIFTILIVIGMKIASKKDEIEIMQLLGATRWYIRMPFLIEGVLYGVIGSTVAFLIGVGPYLYMQAPLARFFQSQAQGFTIFPSAYIFLAALFGIQIAIGMIIGAIGSFIALWRYLRT